jgi:dienelactone hydrolase
MHSLRLVSILLLAMFAASTAARSSAQALGEPDRGEPGDEMIQKYLAAEAIKLDQNYLRGIATPADWQQNRDRLKQEYFTMLGLWPLPERTPLAAKITGTIEGNGYRVDMLHYQSRPQLYVTGNLYRPTKVAAGERLPAVLYVCGHWNQGRDGNKTACQSFGVWLARHGYICLIVDSLQLGEIAATHHGTYRFDRWWWHSRGYTPAGVECWNGVCGIDYLAARDDVDPERIAVTGISGGGAATFWIAAADERVKVAVPTSGMADLQSYVANRVINGHCDCMFLYNSYQWPWTQIAALIAPRALLFTNSDHDGIFPMDANGRITNRLEQVYSLYGAGDVVDTLVSMGGHAYRRDLRQGIYRFINTHLKNDPRHVDDSEVDAWAPEDRQVKAPIAPERLRVFPSDGDIPRDELNTTIDEHFVPVAKVALPVKGEFDRWKSGLMADLKRLPLRALPDRIPAARLIEAKGDVMHLATEDGIEIYLERLAGSSLADAKRVLLVVADGEPRAANATWPGASADDAVYFCEPRGIGRIRWTRKDPPNYVLRSLVLLGRTLDTGRVWDIVAAARYLESQSPHKGRIHVAGEGDSAALAAYAGLIEPEIAGVLLTNPLLTHADAKAPQFLSVLRVCDVPDVLGMLAPKPLGIINGDATVKEPARLDKIKAIYDAAGATTALTLTAHD